MDVLRGLERLEARHVHAQFIFLDPPYAAAEEYEKVLEFLGESSAGGSRRPRHRGAFEEARVAGASRRTGT